MDAKQGDAGRLGSVIGRGKNAHAAEGLDDAQCPDLVRPQGNRLAKGRKDRGMDVRHREVIDDGLAGSQNNPC